MKIGDLVQQDFTESIKRSGIVLEKSSIFSQPQYYKVSWFPHPDLPIFGDNIYSDLAIESSLYVISSV